MRLPSASGGVGHATPDRHAVLQIVSAEPYPADTDVLHLKIEDPFIASRTNYVTSLTDGGRFSRSLLGRDGLLA